MKHKITKSGMLFLFQFFYFTSVLNKGQVRGLIVDVRETTVQLFSCIYYV